jgi:hypothetical protein
MKVSVDLDVFAGFAKDVSSISAQARWRVITGYLQIVKASGLTRELSRADD